MLSVETRHLEVRSRGEGDIVNLTPMIEKQLRDVGMRDGIVTVFVSGSTGAITTIEYEPGLIKDLPAALERIAPRDAYYAHEERWHDRNGHSHVRASIIGPSLTIPFSEGGLLLGTWQQVVLVELDVRPRGRKITLQFIGVKLKSS